VRLFDGTCLVKEKSRLIGEEPMKQLAAASAALLATTALVHAGGIERNAQSPSILFEEGGYVELGYSFANPDVSGTQVVPAPPFSPAGSTSGDVAPSYGFATFAYKQDLGEALSFAIIVDEPVGADVDYAGIGFAPGYLYAFGTGSQAEINSQQVTAALRYELPSGFSVYGGLRSVSADGNVSLFNGTGGGTANYQMSADGSTEIGYMIGGAYERPDIALRVALTYYSETDHTFTATETTLAGALPTQFQTTIPQQVLLEAQSGVAEGTLVFGSIRWTDWTAFDITPTVYTTAVSPGGSLVDYDNDTWTWTLGGARVLTDNWTALGSVTYEAGQGGFSGNLGPTDGRTSLGLGMRYTQGAMRITAGVSYTWIGDAETEAPNPFPAGTQFSSFTDNTAIGAGIRVGFSF
jgi:long-subunit fatty acid transport protein